jgi:outer membrane lipoprotein-sorting protein
MNTRFSFRRAFPSILLLFTFRTVSSLWSQTPPNSELDRILQKMEESGSRMKCFQAELTQKKYIAVLQEYDPEENGMFFYAKGGDGSALIRKEIKTPTPTVVVINKGDGMVYYPKIKQAQKISLGQHKDKAEFMAVGVGQSSKKLRDTFHIRFIQHEVLEGTPTSVLELKPKSDKAAAFLSIITLWMDEQNWLPIQSKLQEPNDDYQMTRFRNVKINIPIPDSTFSMKLPSDVEILTQQ